MTKDSKAFEAEDILAMFPSTGSEGLYTFDCQGRQRCDAFVAQWHNCAGT